MTFKTTVRDAKGQPIAGALVAANIENTGATYFRSTDGEGYADVALLGYDIRTGDRVTFFVLKDGYQQHVEGDALTVTAEDQVLAITLTPSFKRPLRPAPVPQGILPPFDADDRFGQVHTVLPPEQVIPPHFTDPAWLRADFNGVTLDLDRWNPKAPAPLPFLAGANSTPTAMLMTPMLVMYPRYWQDACLTEHAERGYDDFIVAPGGWNMPENGFTPTPANLLAWGRYVRSWGFRLVVWQGDVAMGLDPIVRTLLDAGLVSFYIHGKEVDSAMTAEQFDLSLQQVDAFIGGRLPIGVHFTADGQRHMGYPIGFPRDTFLNDWSPYDGRVHLCQQLDVDASAGLQGASMYYARLHVNAGIGDAAKGPGAPNSRVIAFETMATAQLYGRCTEAQGCLRSWELLCGTRDTGKTRPVSGFGNGGRRPDGRAI